MKAFCRKVCYRREDPVFCCELMGMPEEISDFGKRQANFTKIAFGFVFSQVCIVFSVSESGKKPEALHRLENNAPAGFSGL